MPSVYAHERFGWQVLKRLPEPIKAVVEKHSPRKNTQSIQGLGQIRNR